MPTAALRPCLAPGCAALVTHGRCPAHYQDRNLRRTTFAVRRWYRTVRWTRLRHEVLTESAYACAACGQVALVLDVDHITPHQGDPALFWARTNLQALCHLCHTRKTNREQQAGPPTK